MVCEDNESIATVIRIMLENSGFEVITLASGRGILKKVAFLRPDLILLDLWLPGIDGEGITAILKKSPLTKHIPIVIVSALHKSEIVRITKKVKADSCLSKPFSMNALLDVVNRYTS